MIKSLSVLFLSGAVALFGQTESPNPASTSAEQAAANVSSDENARPIDPSNMDLSVKPADDFFIYANGGWLKRTEIPPEYSRWGSFNQLIEHNNDALHAIAEKSAKTKANDPTTQKVGD